MQVCSERGHVPRTPGLEGRVFALDDKVKAMLEYERPSSLRELRGFLGLMSYSGDSLRTSR